MPPLFSRMAVRRMMECGALSGLVLRRTDMLPQATFERAEMLLTRTSDALLCLEAYEKQGYRLILPESREWPKALRALGGREPLFLVMKGNAALLERRTVAVAGSREIAPATNDMAARLGAMLAEEGITMVCGGARGVDRAAQDALLDADGSLILVPAVSAELACARDKEAAALQTGRLLLSETLPDAPFSAARALARNHTIYALGNAIVVCGQKRRWRLARGDGGVVRQFFVGLRAGRETARISKGNRALFEYGARRIDLSGKRTIGEQLCVEEQISFSKPAKEA
ncbi:MAG: DNA-processing protein DprA [Christensenellales bacterium]